MSDQLKFAITVVRAGDTYYAIFHDSSEEVAISPDQVVFKVEGEEGEDWKSIRERAKKMARNKKIKTVVSLDD